MCFIEKRLSQNVGLADEGDPNLCVFFMLSGGKKRSIGNPYLQTDQGQMDVILHQECSEPFHSNWLYWEGKAQMAFVSHKKVTEHFQFICLFE